MLTVSALGSPAHAESRLSGRCVQYEPALRYAAGWTGWSVSRMSYLMWRESRCQASVVNVSGGDSGLLQIHPVSWPWLSRKFGVTVTRQWLQHPHNNIAAGAALYRFWQRAGYSGYHPWAVR